MPQLLPFYFVNMLSFSFLLFLVILYVLSTYVLPTYPLLHSVRMALVKLPISYSSREYLSYNTLYVALTPLLLSSWVYLLGGLLEISQYLLMYLDDPIQTVLSFLVPIMIYHNPDIDK